MIIERLEAQGDFELLTHGDLSFQQMLSRQFEIRQKDAKGLRCSGLGYPAVLQALSWLGFPKEEVDFQSKLRFFTGDVFEAEIVALCRSIGIKITGDQTKLTFHGISGHCDGILELETGQKKLLEIKTANDNFFKMVQRNPKNLEDRGYLTQVSVYCEALGLPEYLILINNKNTGELLEVEGEPDLALIGRAARIIQKIKLLEKPEDILAPGSGLSAPPPEEEVFKKQATGKLLVPTSMKYSPYAGAFYKTRGELNGYNKLTGYVVGLHETVTSESLKEAFNREKTK